MVDWGTGVGLASWIECRSLAVVDGDQIVGDFSSR